MNQQTTFDPANGFNVSDKSVYGNGYFLLPCTIRFHNLIKPYEHESGSKRYTIDVECELNATPEFLNEVARISLEAFGLPFHHEWVNSGFLDVGSMGPRLAEKMKLEFNSASEKQKEWMARDIAFLSSGQGFRLKAGIPFAIHNKKLGYAVSAKPNIAIQSDPSDMNPVITQRAFEFFEGDMTLEDPNNSIWGGTKGYISVNPRTYVQKSGPKVMGLGITFRLNQQGAFYITELKSSSIDNSPQIEIAGAPVARERVNEQGELQHSGNVVGAMAAAPVPPAAAQQQYVAPVGIQPNVQTAAVQPTTLQMPTAPAPNNTVPPNISANVEAQSFTPNTVPTSSPDYAQVNFEDDDIPF